MSLNNDQLDSVVREVLDLKKISKGIFLTNSPRVAHSIAKTGIEPKSIHVALDNEEEATELHLESGMSVYVAPIREVAIDLRRKVDRLFLEADVLTDGVVDLVGEVITHGLKNSGLTCLISSERSEGEFEERVEEFIANMQIIFKSDLSYEDKFQVYLESFSLAMAAIPWEIEASKRKLQNMSSMLAGFTETPSYLTLPEAPEDELPYRGTRSVAVLTTAAKKLAMLAVKIKNAQIPEAVFLATDGHVSSGMAYVTSTIRDDSRTDLKKFLSKSSDKICAKAPPFFLSEGGAALKKIGGRNDQLVLMIVGSEGFLKRLGGDPETMAKELQLLQEKADIEEKVKNLEDMKDRVIDLEAELAKQISSADPNLEEVKRLRDEIKKLDLPGAVNSLDETLEKARSIAERLK